MLVLRQVGQIWCDVAAVRVLIFASMIASEMCLEDSAGMLNTVGQTFPTPKECTRSQKLGTLEAPCPSRSPRSKPTSCSTQCLGSNRKGYWCLILPNSSVHSRVQGWPVTGVDDSGLAAPRRQSQQVPTLTGPGLEEGLLWGGAQQQASQIPRISRMPRCG